MGYPKPSTALEGAAVVLEHQEHGVRCGVHAVVEQLAGARLRAARQRLEDRHLARHVHLVWCRGAERGSALEVRGRVASREFGEAACVQAWRAERQPKAAQREGARAPAAGRTCAQRSWMCLGVSTSFSTTWPSPAAAAVGQIVGGDQQRDQQLSSCASTGSSPTRPLPAAARVANNNRRGGIAGWGAAW